MSQLEDLSLRKYGRLTVIERGKDRVTPSGRKLVTWECVCDCGNHFLADGQGLRSGNIKSCGCLHKETARQNLISYTQTHGESKTRLYRIWAAMRRRCNNPNCDAYKWYGARGISVCREWNTSFLAFRNWAYQNGYKENAKQEECSLDRIDGNKDYSPENCRWVTKTVQSRNTRRNHLVEYQGKKMTIAELAELSGIPYARLQPRIKALGWSAEKAVNTPFKKPG